MRVLLLGNIANNAFYAATLLRRAGVEADVFCPDDYWVMSSPEWEEADFDQPPKDQTYPDWWAMDLKGYQRPRWFSQGPFSLAVDYLVAVRRGETARAEGLWRELDTARRLIARDPEHRWTPPKGAESLSTKVLKYRRARQVRNLYRRIARYIPALQGPPDPFLKRAAAVSALYSQRFPERSDRLEVGEIEAYRQRAEQLSKLFPYYDVVQGNAVDPLYPLIADFHPYVAFEHGTLRDSPEVTWTFKGPFYPNTIGRLTALSYREADYVYITNADCRSSAERLRLERYTAIPHPFDEQAFAPEPEAAAAIRARLGVDHLFLCPIRHDWVDKGTDKYIRALPELRKKIPGKFVACFMPWGRQIDDSKALIKQLGVEDLVAWVGPFGRRSFVRWISAADAIWDQLAFASFSGLGPRAMSVGSPVIAAYEHEGLAWMFPEPAPMLNARSVEDVIEQSLRAIEPGFRQRHAEICRAWIHKHHSGEVVVKKLVEGYEAAIRRGRQR
ncbi:MAG: glycosyltransferase [Myxococcota bacterium]